MRRIAQHGIQNDDRQREGFARNPPKVLQAVKKLNYKPNMTAQMLKSGSARLIGLIIPDIVNPYYPQIVKTLEDLAMEAGYSIILCDAQGDAKREKIILKRFSACA